MSQFRVVYTVPYVAATVKAKLRMFGGNKLNGLGSYTDAISGGVYNGVVRVATTAVAATGTVTFSSIANNDTVTVNGRVYTAKTSGATGLQQFNIGGSDAQAALNFQAILNADTSTLVANVVTASSQSSAVSLITALVPGNIGNLGTLAISAHGSVSGANLTGGSEDTNVTINKG
jgi:hypothetical protein